MPLFIKSSASDPRSFVESKPLSNISPVLDPRLFEDSFMSDNPSVNGSVTEDTEGR